MDSLMTMLELLYVRTHHRDCKGDGWTAWCKVRTVVKKRAIVMSMSLLTYWHEAWFKKKKKNLYRLVLVIH